MTEEHRTIVDKRFGQKKKAWHSVFQQQRPSKTVTLDQAVIKGDQHGRPIFIHHGGEAFSDQQREIYVIEGELNYRYQHGDKDAELKRAMPGIQH